MLTPFQLKRIGHHNLMFCVVLYGKKKSPTVLRSYILCISSARGTCNACIDNKTLRCFFTHPPALAFGLEHLKSDLLSKAQYRQNPQPNHPPYAPLSSKSALSIFVEPSSCCVNQ